jgi:hypothetical protein
VAARSGRGRQHLTVLQPSYLFAVKHDPERTRASVPATAPTMHPDLALGEHVRAASASDQRPGSCVASTTSERPFPGRARPPMGSLAAPRFAGQASLVLT